MRSRFRSLDSKISFFAFADIITAVSGMLIFITLLLATDLGRPSGGQTQSGDPEKQRRLEAALREQVEADARNRRLQGLLAAAETAPGVDKLQGDLARLREELAAEQKKQAAVDSQLAGSRQAIEARDKTLGLTDVKASIQGVIAETGAIASQEAKVHGDMASLDQRVAGAQARLLKLKQLEGNLWLLPDRSTGSKEPIIVTVNGNGIAIEKYGHPEQRRQLDVNGADSGLRDFLGTAKPTDQYVVFEMKPSGISLCAQLLKTARAMQFEVGFDALEEGKMVHVGAPPVVDEMMATAETNRPAGAGAGQGGMSAAGGSSSSGVPVPVTNAAPPGAKVPKASSPPPPGAGNSAPPPATKKKSWWQRLMEWLHLA